MGMLPEQKERNGFSFCARVKPISWRQKRGGDDGEAGRLAERLERRRTTSREKRAS